MNKLTNLFNSHKKVFSILIIIGIGGIIVFKSMGNKTSAVQYQTSQAEKGTLIKSISASGNISTGSVVNITTNISGIVSEIYVKNGDTVTTGQKIADITLDRDSLQKQSSAWASYLSAQNSLQSAKDKMNSLQAAEFKANQTFMLDAVARELATNDPVYIQENALWLQAEADYKNQAAVINQVQASLTSAWYSYQQTSPTIVAPSSGTISNLTIATGIPVEAMVSSSNNSSSSTSQVIGTITLPSGSTQAKVNLSEVDSPNVNPGQKATLTLDAFPGKTFTGKVLLIDTNGAVSSGVTTYPATINFDTTENNIYPNMAVTATIITNIKDNVLLIPSGATITSNGSSTVQVMKNGKPQIVMVEIGDSNDTQTEIISGINEGDTIVTNVINPSSTSSTGTQSTSPFSSFGGTRGGFGGGGNVRIQGR